MKRKALTVVFILVLAVSMLNAKDHSEVSLLDSNVDKDAGKYGFQFLKIPSSPELAAMANTGEMQHNSPLTIFHHPAAFRWERGSFIALSQTNWFVGSNMYNLAWRNVKLRQSFGLGLVYMDHGSFDRRTENGTEIGSYYPMDLKATGNYAFKLTPNIHLGANVNLIYEKIDTSSALAFSTDIGYVFLTPLRNTTFDLAVKNIGVSTKMDIEKIDMPLTMEAGLSTGFDIDDFLCTYHSTHVSIYPALKLTYMRDHDNLMPAVGMQVKFYDMFFLRMGYKFNYNEEDLSAGFGVHIKNIRVDYSFMNNAIENIHMFGVGWAF